MKINRVVDNQYNINLDLPLKSVNIIHEASSYKPVFTENEIAASLKILKLSRKMRLDNAIYCHKKYHTEFYT